MSKFFYTILKPFSKIFGPIAMRYWTHWSNARFADTTRTNLSLLAQEDTNIKTWSDIHKLLLRLFSKYTWTEDGADQLWDAITPPPQNYSNYLSGGVFDDCDGFHSLLHYPLSCNGFEAYLLSVSTLGSGHCTLLLRLEDKWCVIDYASVYPAFDTPAEAIADYASVYPKKYGSKFPIWFCGLISYDYTEGKFHYAGTPKRFKRSTPPLS